MADLTRPRRLSLWRVLVWGGGIFLALIALVALLVALESWRGHRAWAACQRDLAALGEKLDFKAFVPPPIPDEQNFAATPLFAGLKFQPEAGPEQMPWPEDCDRAERHLRSQRAGRSPRADKARAAFPDMEAWARAFRIVRTGDPEQRIPITAPPDATLEVCAALEVLEALKVYDAALDQVRQAARRPASRFPINYSQDNPAMILLPHLAKLRKICSVLQLRTVAEIVAGQGQAALEDMLLMLRVADAVKDEPLLLSQLVRVACFQVAIEALDKGLAARVWTEPQLNQLQAWLAQIDFVATTHQALRAERAFGVATLESLLRRPVSAAEANHGPDGWLDPAQLLPRLLPTGWVRFEQANYCRALQQMLLPDTAIQRRHIDPRLVGAKQAALDRASTNPWKALIQHRIFSKMLLPGLSSAYSRAGYAQTLAHQATVACALERYRLARGEFPDNLETLVPAYLQQVPPDVVSGQPLRYSRTTSGGFILWSVGWDGIDDGGVPARTHRKVPSGDWVWESPVQ